MTIDVAGWFFCVQNVKACEVVRLIDWDGLKREFEETDATLKDLADKYGVKYATARSRKSREGWEKEKKKSSTKKERAATPIKKDATQKKNVATRNTQQPRNVATKKAVEELEESETLSEQQKQFCLEYSRFPNATKAYMKAYGCSWKTADASSYKLMGRIGIREEIKRIKEARNKDWLVDDAVIIQEWLKMAFSDITDYVEFRPVFVDYAKDDEGMPKLDEFGEMIPIYRNEVHFKDSNQVDGTIIQEVKKGKDGVSIKLYDKQRALDTLLKLMSGGDAHKADMLQIQIEKARLELAEAKANALGGDDGMDDDGLLSAIDQSLDAVWGDLDE